MKKGRKAFVVGVSRPSLRLDVKHPISRFLADATKVGMSKFHKPKKEPGEGPHYDELARVAVTRALQDCCLKPGDIEQARRLLHKRVHLHLFLS